jgi:outer membrane protein assembly factor BamB
VAGWCDAEHLLLHLNRGAGVWSLASKRIVWRAPGQGAAWGGQMLTLGNDGTLEIRVIHSGSVARSRQLVFEKMQAIHTVGDVLMVDTGGTLVGVSLPAAEPKWTVLLDKEFPRPDSSRPVYAKVFEGSMGHAVVKYDAGLMRIDLETAVTRWKTTVPTDHLPVVSAGRIGFLSHGDLLVLDEATGEPLATARKAVETLWESRPCAHGDWMVVVDERGHIVTVALSDGKVLGIQKEKGVGFGDCVSVDGRLLVAGEDGALWVYEPNEAPTPAALRRTGRNAPTGELSSSRGRAHRSARGTKRKDTRPGRGVGRARGR